RIMYSKNEEILPISNLSGGERSKLILMLLSYLIRISNKSSFFIIDEPNELLDPYNINNMKSLFSRLFRNKQIIICTFIENYKSFKPALIYHIEKDKNNISSISQISPKRGKRDSQIFQEKARKFIIPTLNKMGFTKIKGEVKIAHGFLIDIFATSQTNHDGYIKKALGEIIPSTNIAFFKRKIEKFSHMLLSLKNDYYYPERGDIALIIFPNQPVRREIVQVTLDLLKTHFEIHSYFLLEEEYIVFICKEPKYEKLIKEFETRLEDIPGISFARAKRLSEVGVNSINDLLQSNSKILAAQLKGIGIVLINKWKRNAKILLEKEQEITIKEK
ncbi:MAG: hypothetical protein ACFFCV_20705, partial [Promethearchaeota archaeon]